MNDESKDMQDTGNDDIDGLIMGFAALMIVLVVIVIASTLSGTSETNTPMKSEKTQSAPSE